MNRLLAALLALLIAVAPAFGQERKSYSQAELDQVLAPVALYPDSLLSQVLMASTYPLEVVEAARWSRAHPGIQGDEAVRGAADKDWDPSVKSLLAFPNLLARMDENLEWTRRLGDAFLAQETDVMETVQQLRQRAQAAGGLAPDERQRVVADGRTIAIEPADPRVVYVPYYDPYVAYGPWWWSAYPPVVWAPWPGYAVVRPGFWWGVGVGVTAGFFFGGMDWHHHHVKVVSVHNHYVRPAYVKSAVHGHKPVHPGKWQHDTWHRHGVGQRYEQRRVERRNEVRAQPMPPAFRAASPQQQPRTVSNRPQAQPQPRMESHRPPMQPRVESHRPAVQTQPRVESHRSPVQTQPRVESHRPAVQTQPRMEAHRPQVQSQPRMESRGGGSGGGNGGGRGGEHGGRGQGRG